MAGESNTHNSISFPVQTFDINAKAVLVICETIKYIKETTGHNIKLFHALSSEMFDSFPITPGLETMSKFPRTPYSIAKLASYNYIKYYRSAYNLHISTGIIFNTESPFRKPDFLPRKISIKIANILKGDLTPLFVGNLLAKRNWLHAGDVAYGIRLIMKKSSSDYVLSNGKSYSVQDLITLSYSIIGINLVWIQKENEIHGCDNSQRTWVISKGSDRFFEPTVTNVYGYDTRLSDWKCHYDIISLMTEMILAEEH